MQKPPEWQSNDCSRGFCLCAHTIELERFNALSAAAGTALDEPVVPLAGWDSVEASKSQSRLSEEPEESESEVNPPVRPVSVPELSVLSAVLERLFNMDEDESFTNAEASNFAKSEEVPAVLLDCELNEVADGACVCAKRASSALSSETLDMTTNLLSFIVRLNFVITCLKKQLNNG